MAFREWLAAQLAERDWGVAEAAAHIGVSHSMVSRYLSGKALPERRGLRAIAATFGVGREALEAMVDADRPPPKSPIPPPFLDAFAEQLADRLADEVAERLLERLTAGSEEMETVLQRAGVEDSSTLDDRIPVLFSGVVWEELTDAEKAGVIALAKRLMGRPQGRMGRRRRQE
jgi:transcriptional regulator with XRE-family HTH domain